jgi:PAS domain S-box-containing protein
VEADGFETRPYDFVDFSYIWDKRVIKAGKHHSALYPIASENTLTEKKKKTKAAQKDDRPANNMAGSNNKTTDKTATPEAVPESGEMFRSIVEFSHAGIFIVDDSFHITYANEQLSALLGYPPAEIIGADFRKLLDAASTSLVADRYVRRQRGETLPSRYEIGAVRKDGTHLNLELSSSVIKGADGKTITIGQVLDITERKQAETALQKAREELERRVEERTAALKQEIDEHHATQEALKQSDIKSRHLIDYANSIILEMSPTGDVNFLNPYGLEFFGFSESEIVGKNVVGTIVPARDTTGRDLEAMIQDIVQNPVKYRHNENENITRTGERVWIVWTNQPLFDEQGRLLEILCIGIDRTSEKKMEEERDEREKEQAAAAERSRLARDLHDAVSQTLFSASLVAEVLPRLWERNQAEGRKRLEEIRQLTRGALAEMRTLLLELRPAALVDAELGDLLHQLGESITGRARVPVDVTVAGECHPSPEVKIALYRIAQEALNNVAKHSGAARAKVELTCTGARITLSIRDNGRGFDMKNTLPDSLGLGIMRERAKDINADITIESRPGEGTEVRVVWEAK